MIECQPQTSARAPISSTVSGNLAIHTGFKRSGRDTPAVALANDGEGAAPTFAHRRLVLGSNSWEPSSIQALGEARPGYCSR
jgi:hypothetical protein